MLVRQVCKCTPLFASEYGAGLAGKYKTHILGKRAKDQGMNMREAEGPHVHVLENLEGEGVCFH